MSPEKEFVISGLSGRFPESKNIKEFWENLIQGKDMVTEHNRRWDIDSFKMPRRMGKIPELDSFDAEFFGVPGKQAETMDPRIRLLLEVTYEAILDSGCNPRALYGSKTGVFFCGSLNEAFDIWIRSSEEPSVQLVPASQPCMLANRVSYAFNFQGPSYSVETGCSSSFVALNNALLALKSGQCDAAVVGGASINLLPSISLAMSRYKMLSSLGKCKTFDAECDGFVRSEAVVVLYICGTDAAKRAYAMLAGARCNNDGYKADGLSYPSKHIQETLLREVYAEAGINPLDVAYVETHGTGTKAGDPQEVHALAEVFCKGRDGPLLVGSVKSNMGHAECISGFCGISKVLMSSLSGIIPANLHFKTPNPECSAILDGRIKVVTEKTPFTAQYVGISSFGFGCTNSHVILKFWEHQKYQLGYHEIIPDLVFASGRTTEAVKFYLENALESSSDHSLMSLLRNITTVETPRHPFYGYGILKEGKPEIRVEEKDTKTSIWFVYTGVGSQWVGMCKDMMKFDSFQNSVNESVKILKKNGFDLDHLLQTQDVDLLNKNALISITSIQIALTDLIKSVGIRPDGIVGHSVGEIVCGYADDCITQEQALLTSWSTGRSLLETTLPSGTLASIGLSLEDARVKCPPDIFPAIHNSKSNVTVVGPAESIRQFVQQLKDEGAFAKEVKFALYGFHSKYVLGANPFMLHLLQKVIPEPKQRSGKWLSTSIQELNWGSDLAKFCSPEYLANNIVSPVYLHETLQHIPDNAIVLEIAPHCFLQSILKETLKDKSVSIGLMHCKSDDNALFFLQSMGKLFLFGIHTNIAALYPHVNFPISGKTLSISPWIQWDHSVSWDVPDYRKELSSGKGTKYSINPSVTDCKYLQGHALQGKVVFPATGYLWLVWKVLAKQRNTSFEQLAVQFENVHFKRATELHPNDDINFSVSIFSVSGQFEVTEGQEIVCEGKVCPLGGEDAQNEMFSLKRTAKHMDNAMVREDFYKMVQLRGYEYRDTFQGVVRIDTKGNWAELEWKDNWVCFLDTILQIQLVNVTVEGLSVPVQLEEAVIDPCAFMKEITQNPGLVMIKMSKNLDVSQCPGIQFKGTKFSGISAIQTNIEAKPSILEQRFLPYFDAPNTVTDKATAAEFVLGIAADNTIGNTLIVTEVLKYSQPLFTDPNLNALTAGRFEILEHRVLASSETICNKDSTKRFNNLADLKNQGNSHIVVTDDMDAILDCEDLVVENGFVVLTSASAKFDPSPRFSLVAQNMTEFETLSLFRRLADDVIKIDVVSLDTPEYCWVADLQYALRSTPENNRIVLLTMSANSGIIGFTKCLLKEPGGKRIRCFQISGPKSCVPNLEEFESSEQFKAQTQKDLVFNIYQDGVWGCFSNFLLPASKLEGLRSGAEAYADIKVVGDLSSLCWIESPCKLPLQNPFKIYYSALNFKDIMHATGKLSKSTLPKQLHSESCILGFEFSGTFGQQRICGLAPNKCLATALETKPSMMWYLPDSWSLADAATVPAVYATAIYGLIMRANLKPKESVLIHSGSGGVGLAAITLALSMNCTVYTTVGSQEKREVLMARFPQLEDRHISDSRHAKIFEGDILEQTEGRGVDVVLNSLVGEKLRASVRCLATNGRFIEIGKYDALNNSSLGMAVLLKSANIQGIYLDALMLTEMEGKSELERLIAEHIQAGIVKPLPFTCFEHEELEDAFRFLASGKHIGKVLVKIRENASAQASIPALPRTYFYHDKTYIVIGGLGGMGLEILDWMVERGAREVFIVSRSGVQNSYQQSRLKKWRETGACIYVENTDVSSINQVCMLLRNASSIAPIGGIFNFALVLEDALFENQTCAKFQSVSNAKATAMAHFDAVSRQLAPSIDHFIVFSSIVANRGNPGQSNYGYANSVMERICENRKSEGLPGLAIQWGLVGDVGYAAALLNGKNYILGLKPQAIKSCIETLDLLLQQDGPVVSSFIIGGHRAKKQVRRVEVSPADTVARILGINDLAKVDPDATLTEMGMDSIMAIEVEQALKKCGIILPLRAYGKLTFKYLLDMK